MSTDLSYPVETKEREEVNFRLGIKSSLSQLRRVFALLYSVYLVNGRNSSVNYSLENRENGSTSLIINEDLFLNLKDFLNIIDDDIENFRVKVNSNPLFTSQIESLQMALETFWRLAEISFLVKPEANTRERTGGNRFNKVIKFSTNILLLDNSLLELDSTPSPDLISLLYAWITGENSSSTNLLLSQRIEDFLTILSEETQFKMRVSFDNQDDEIFFQQEGIYESILKNEEVCSTDSKEAVGAFRILKSATKETMHSFIQDNKQKFMIKQGVTLDKFTNYAQMVSTYLNLIPKRTTLYGLLGSDELIEGSYIDHKQAITKCVPPHQVIFFGSPGTGKSHTIEERTRGASTTRITFHPDTDYQSFVGSYRPNMDGKDIQYKFVPQAFIKAYCHAWLNPNQPHYLIIEEINRGNCAQVFGDIFQCLDRDENGYSKYETEVSTEISDYIKNEFSLSTEEDIENYLEITKSKADKYSNIRLPPNFYLFASMNTSDQSLFPMDSAFKRRWSWQHIPIDYKDADNFVIHISDKSQYGWGEFIRKINPKIRELTGSEDKLLGNRFVNPANDIIEYQDFVSKVLFYLWDEIYKDEYQTANSIFQYKLGNKDEVIEFTFNDLFKENSIQIVESFLEFNEVFPVKLDTDTDTETEQ